MAIFAKKKNKMFIKIEDPKINFEEMFTHKCSWFNFCDFAFTSKDDQWSVPLKNTIEFNPENVPENSIIFATPWGIEKFLKEIHPKIKNKYILITHCYGPVFSVASYVNDPKIIAWFGQANSNAITFDKFTLIPLGIFGTDEVFSRRNTIIEQLKQYKKIPKTKLLYSNFMVHQGQHVERSERTIIYDLFKDKPWCTTVTLTPNWRKTFADYMIEAAQFKFSLAPEGDQHDTYRIWETLSVGSIPIVHTSPLDGLLNDLPVVIVSDYREVTEEFLNNKYIEMHSKWNQYNLEKLYMKYWVSLINSNKI